jgi:hypothetical protein
MMLVYVLFIFTPILAGIYAYQTMQRNDLASCMKAALKRAAKRNAEPGLIFFLPTARLPAFTAEPGVLYFFADRLEFEDFGTGVRKFAMTDLLGRSFRAPSAEEAGLEGLRILRIETAIDFIEFAVPAPFERQVQGLFDFAGVKRAEPPAPAALPPTPPMSPAA